MNLRRSELASVEHHKPVSTGIHSFHVLQVLLAWHGRCLALSDAISGAEQRFVAVQNHALRIALHAWSSNARTAIQCRRQAEQAVLHVVRARQTRALHAWRTVIRHRRWKQSAVLTASNHERRRLLSSVVAHWCSCLLYTSPSPRDRTRSRMPSSA